MPLSFLLNSSPKVWAVADRIYARAPLPLRALSLFSFDRLLMIDRGAREVRISSTWLWTMRRERSIPFARISHVDFDYAGISLGDDPHRSTIDCLERYTVSLELKDPRETVRLFCFTGDLLTTNASAYSIESLALGAGDDRHADAARGFVQRIAEWLSVPLGRPVKHYATATGIKFYCSGCGRPSGPASKSCMYCGGTLDAVVDAPADATAEAQGA